MASVVIHVDIDIDKIKAKLDRANKELTKNVAKDTESKFLPWLNGTLAARTRILDDEISASRWDVEIPHRSSEGSIRKIFGIYKVLCSTTLD